MQELTFVGSCDMTFAGTGERVSAPNTVYLAVGADPDRLTVLQLDLCDDWHKTFTEDVLPFVRAAHKPGEVLTPAGARRSPGAHEGAAGKRAWTFNRNMRAWADANEMGGEYRKLAKGGYYHSSRLQDAYAEYLQSLAGLRDTAPAAS